MARARKQARKRPPIGKRRPVARLLRWALLAILALYAFVALDLLLLRWIDPPTTAVQIERRISAWAHHANYHKRYLFLPLASISRNLQHAVITAEDARFFEHHGFDWKEIENAVQDDWEDKRERGASTISQQLVRNLFLSTGRSYIRKGLEFSIVPFAEAILGKQRILELYLNVIEWGPGIYGAEAAARTYFDIPAQRLTREESAQLASVLPAPLHRTARSMSPYAKRILLRMRQMGW